MVTTISTSSTRLTANASGGLCSAKNAGVQQALAASCQPHRRSGRVVGGAPPYQPPGHADHGVEHGPDRRRTPNSAACRAVGSSDRYQPRAQRPRRSEPSAAADQQAQSDEPDQREHGRDRCGRPGIGAPFVWIGVLEDTALSNRTSMRM